MPFSIKPVFIIFSISSIIFIGCQKGNGSDPVDPKPEIAKTVMLITREFDSNSDLITGMTAFNMNGSVKWKRPNLGRSGPPPIVYNNGVVFAAVSYFAFIGSGPNYISYNNLYAMDANTGVDVWSITNSQDNIYSMAVRNDTLYCSQVNGNINSIAAYSTSNGNLLWKKTIPFLYAANHLALDGNILYFIVATSSTVNNVIAYDLTSKTVKWNSPIGINLGNMYSRMVITGNSVYVKNGTGALIAYDKSTGQMRWTKNSFAMEQPVFSENIVYSLSAEHGMFAYDAQSGNEAWHWTSSYWFMGGDPYVSDKLVFISGVQNSGFIAAFHAADGTPFWRKDMNDVLQFPLVVGDKLFLFKNKVMNTGYSNSKIMIYDAATGLAKDSITLVGENFDDVLVISESGKFFSPN